MPPRPPYPPPLGAQPSWLGLHESADPGGPGPGNESPLPGEGWPAIESIDYVSKLIGLIVLLLALPWLLERLLSHPSQLPHHAAAMTNLGA